MYGYKLEIKEFPLKTQLGIFHNEQEIEAWLLEQDRSDIFGIDYALIGHAPVIFTPFVEEALARYNFTQKGHPSYTLLFDDLPARWVETMTFIDSEIAKATRSKNGNH